MSVHTGLQGRVSTDSALEILVHMRDECPVCGGLHKPARDLALMGDSLVIGYCHECYEGFVTHAYVYYTGGREGRLWPTWSKVYPMHPDDIRALPGIPPDFTFPF